MSLVSPNSTDEETVLELEFRFTFTVPSPIIFLGQKAPV